MPAYKHEPDSKLEDSFSGVGNNTSKGIGTTRIVCFDPLIGDVLARF
jgi:hypothetical protein